MPLFNWENKFVLILKRDKTSIFEKFEIPSKAEGLYKILLTNSRE